MPDADCVWVGCFFHCVGKIRTFRLLIATEIEGLAFHLGETMIGYFSWEILENWEGRWNFKETT